jgi:hypothetical protein
MQFIRHIQEKAKPYPALYNVLARMYSPLREAKFFFHALFTGKLFNKFDKNLFSGFLSRQKILSYHLRDCNVSNADAFRQWLEEIGVTYQEGGWTFYLPPQNGLYEYFQFLARDYPPDAGIKILKDFRAPEKAKYTNHKNHAEFSSGAALKRLLTPSPVSLVRVANYLYAQGLGVRIYDIIALKCVDKTLTGYIVQHIEGPDIEEHDYAVFMKKMDALLKQGDIKTIHESTDIMADFNPPNCSGNLILNRLDGRPVFVDFQGFLLNDEEKIINEIVDESREKVHFGDVRFYRKNKKYLYQSIPGCSIGKRDIEKRWSIFLEMLAEARCSLEKRVIYDIGCNTGLMLYNALSEGARWSFGWDLPETVAVSKRILLSLGATRFDFVGETIGEQTDFISKIPERYKTQTNGVLFFLAISNHIGFPVGVSELPWEYMFYEGHADQDYEYCLERLHNVDWLKGSDILSYRCFADGDTPERVVLLLKRSLP